ncbi:hypothetical protein R1sor_009475 [Riccia sorocarpa]|uniref:Uncharacterized protein n=1 Tax=Riccia sorocarpa TaxID=122646 RepID=A0ABD3HYK4_9MARC
MLRVHIYHMQGAEEQLVSMGLIGYKEGETLLSLRNKLESTQYFSSSFQFWDTRLSSPVLIKLECLIFIEDMDGKVVVFETKDLKVGLEPLSGKGVTEKAVLDGKKELALVGDAPFEYTEPEEVVVNSSVASSEPSVVGDDSLEEKDWLELSQGPVRTGSKGRPRKSDPRDMKKQRSIDSFFGGARSQNSSCLPSSDECVIGDERLQLVF